MISLITAFLLVFLLTAVPGAVTTRRPRGLGPHPNITRAPPAPPPADHHAGSGGAGRFLGGGESVVRRAGGRPGMVLLRAGGTVPGGTVECHQHNRRSRRPRERRIHINMRGGRGANLAYASAARPD